MLKIVQIYKKLGETPLQALERFRADMIVNEPSGASLWRQVPMTYAGRLDPMAEGQLIILIGDECKNKEKYLGLDKEYEVEIVFGIDTDTYDALGLATLQESAKNIDKIEFDKLDLQKYAGKFIQEYPAYSSKTFNGKQLHTLARAGKLPDGITEEMPTKEVEIYDIKKLDVYEASAKDLLVRITSMIDLVGSDFRQDQIKRRWNEVLCGHGQASTQIPSHFTVLKCLIKCSSGTYMRSLANKIGHDLGVGGFAIAIKRTRIG